MCSRYWACDLVARASRIPVRWTAPQRCAANQSRKVLDCTRDCLVKRLLDLIGMSVGGWLGWTAGAAISFFTAFVVSIVGTGLGLYAIRRLTRGIS